MSDPSSARPAPVRHAAPSDRFGKFVERRDGKDFPYYTGVPVGFTVQQWILLWISVAVGFAALVTLPQSTPLVALLPRILFVAIPLGTLAYLARDQWKALFRKVNGADVRTMIGFAVLNLVVTSILALIVKALFGTAENPAVDGSDGWGALDYVAFYAGTGIQLVGEELFTIIPFLALLYFLVTKGKLPRTTAIVLAWLISAVWFGAAHLPTYDWNFAQALIVIGGARLVLTLAYIRTKNLTVSIGAHIINDWVLFTQSLFFSTALIAL
ncbi:CPBP family intramembrane glutamic endopeptidase [Rhodococcus sp. NPDC058505]|uniref:CPBP family intramembrane glutamic endopeptidase n=1 Tax=Rhodococcus sp. NPDC058505 TaxID=3346531 RepID=UPI00365C2751